MNLTEFLLARIAEDEAVARAATNGPWRHDARKEWHTDPQRLATARRGWHVPGGEEFVGAADGIICVAATGPSDERQSMLDAEHIARHDPARVLAECEAKRRIVAEYESPDSKGSYVDGLWHALACLALPYADHPDYRSEWAP